MSKRHICAPGVALVIRCLCIGVMVATAFGATGVSASQAPPISKLVLAKIEPQVLSEASTGGLHQFALVLTHQANLAGAARLATKRAKGRYVFRHLWNAAARTQPAVCARLTQLGLRYRTFYIINAIIVGNPADEPIAASAVLALARRADVARIESLGRPTFDGNVSPAGPHKAKAVPTTPGLYDGWNVDWIGAGALHQRGITGKGIVIGVSDSGEDYTHPALRREYRGYNGPGRPVKNNYNWFDASTFDVSTSPIDQNGHGTFSTSVAVGDGGPGEHIGVAPGAKWIGCRSVGNGASDATVLECLQWFLAPTTTAGRNPDPDKAPDVVNNSYFCNVCGLESAVVALRDAGIYAAFAGGNAGPRCRSIGEPADSASATAVGALASASDYIAFFSSRGANSINQVKPDIVAPGTHIIGAFLKTKGYDDESGTSFAAPALAGAVALLWSADPHLIGNVAATNDLLFKEATPKPTDTSCDPRPEVPNNTYGFGELHVGGPAPQISALVPSSLVQGARNRLVRVFGNHFEPHAFGTFGPYEPSHPTIKVDSTRFVSSTEVDLRVNIAPTDPPGVTGLSIVEPNGGATTAGSSPMPGLPSFSVDANPAFSPWHVKASFLPPAGNLAAVACPSTSTCFAVGHTETDAPSIMSTPDGGATWRTQNPPKGLGGLRSIACPSISDCFAVGSAETRAPYAPLMLHTTDGGKTWTDEKIASGVGSLVSVACPSTTRCFAAGRLETGSAGAMVATINAGTTWRRQALPSQLASVAAVLCPTTTRCFAGGAAHGKKSITATRDGGATWMADALPRHMAVTSLACTSASHCFALGGAFGHPSRMVATANSGRTWKSRTPPPGVQSVSAVACPSSSHCLALALACPASTGCIAPGSRGAAEYILGSTNGGITWTGEFSYNSDLTQGASDLRDIACASTSSCVAVGDAAAILSTTDGGKTWTGRTAPFAMTGGTISGIACPSAADCFAAGYSGAAYGDNPRNPPAGAVLATTDGGATWVSQNVPLAVGALNGIVCPSTSDCFAVGYGGAPAGGTPTTAVVLATTDAGGAWVSRPIPSGLLSLNGVACPSTSDCFAVGDDGAVATTDGGATWVTETVPAAVTDLDGIACFSTSSCVAVGAGSSGGAIVNTADGGKTWLDQTVPSGVAALNGVACPAVPDCLAAGGDGVVASTDGGTTWLSQALPLGAYSLNSIACMSGTACFAVGGSDIGAGVLLATGDGGNTWVSQTLPSRVASLSGISCLPSASCLATGADGQGGAVILRRRG